MLITLAFSIRQPTCLLCVTWGWWIQTRPFQARKRSSYFLLCHPRRKESEFVFYRGYQKTWNRAWGARRVRICSAALFSNRHSLGFSRILPHFQLILYFSLGHLSSLLDDQQIIKHYGVILPCDNTLPGEIRNVQKVRSRWAGTCQCWLLCVYYTKKCDPSQSNVDPPQDRESMGGKEESEITRKKKQMCAALHTYIHIYSSPAFFRLPRACFRNFFHRFLKDLEQVMREK